VSEIPITDEVLRSTGVGAALSSLRLTTPRLVLRLAYVAELRALAELLADGIYPEEALPYQYDWVDTIGGPGWADYCLEYHEGWMRKSQPDDWKLVLTAFAGDSAIGTQDIELRPDNAVTSSSMMARRIQGRGYGTEMRSAVLHLAFHVLGVEHAYSDAWVGNHASLGVTRKLGYEEVGTELQFKREGAEPVLHRVYRLDAERFVSPVPIGVEGAEPLLSWLGGAAERSSALRGLRLVEADPERLR
jgi:RimJ/RimL family protein N-acetyltransferase